MTPTAEKILKYLQERKRPVAAAQLSTHFLQPLSTIRSALHELKEQDLAEFEAISGQPGKPRQLWYYRRRVALSAVPASAPAAPPTPRPSAPRKWTVYDDRAYD